jgi:hypothetical protein
LHTVTDKGSYFALSKLEKGGKEAMLQTMPVKLMFRAQVAESFSLRLFASVFN